MFFQHVFFSFPVMLTPRKKTGEKGFYKSFANYYAYQLGILRLY